MACREERRGAARLERELEKARVSMRKAGGGGGEDLASTSSSLAKNQTETERVKDLEEDLEQTRRELEESKVKREEDLAAFLASLNDVREKLPAAARQTM